MLKKSFYFFMSVVETGSFSQAAKKHYLSQAAISQQISKLEEEVGVAQAIREGKMDIFTDDFKKLTGDDPITVKYMFDHNEDFQIGARHSKDD